MYGFFKFSFLSYSLNWVILIIEENFCSMYVWRIEIPIDIPLKTVFWVERYREYHVYVFWYQVYQARPENA